MGPDPLLRAFEYMSRGQEIFGRFLVAVAIICGGLALITYGILSEASELPESGLMWVAGLGAAAAVSVGGVVALGLSATHTRVREQQSYYELGRFTVSVEQMHLEALQLDGVNAEFGWTETLELWPTLVRFPDGPPKFRTLSLLPPEEAKIQLDRDWGVLSTNDYHERLDALFSGLHSLQFLELAQSEQGNRLLDRVAGVAELPRRDVESVLVGTTAPARLLWGWDLWRVIPLSRNAFMAGLVSEQEAWSHILRASAIVHALFEDLASYHRNLRIGHAFWCDDYAMARARRERLEAFERNEPQRPISGVPWTRRSVDTLPSQVVSAGVPSAEVGSIESRSLH